MLDCVFTSFLVRLFLTWICPLTVLGFVGLGERIGPPCRVCKSKVGGCTLGSSQSEEKLGQHLEFDSGEKWGSRDVFLAVNGEGERKC